MSDSLFGTSTSGGGSLFGPSGSKKKKKKTPWYKAPSGLAKNAAGNLWDITAGTVVGVPMIAKSVGEDVVDVVVPQTPWDKRRDPKDRPFTRTGKIAKAVGQSYADYYGPLFRGDIDQFLTNVYNRPVDFVLDAATVASLGINGAAKAGIVSAKGGKVLTLEMANGEKIVTKPLARGEMRAQLQALAARAKNAQVKAGPINRPAGMHAAKVQRSKLVRKSRNVQAQNAKFNRELRKLRGKPDKVAAFLLGRFDRQGLNAYMDLLRAEAAGNPKGPAAATLKLISNPRVQQRFDAPTPNVRKVLDEARGLGEKQKGLLGISDETAEAARYRPARIAEGARLEGEEWVGGPSIAELKARGLDPVYFPDTDAVKPPVLSFNQGGGKGLPKAPGATKQNTGALMMAGQLIHDPAVLNKSWLESVKFQHYKDTHSSLIEMATESPDIPHGYQAVRELPSEHVPHMDRTRGEFMKAIDDEGVFRQDAPSLTTKSPDTAARLENGNYLVVPDKIVKQMTGDFTRQNEFIRLMNRYPLKVWRALVLGLRPAWLVNNVVGNTMMYLVHSARPNDLRQLAGAFKEFATPKQQRLIDQILDKHFAGQTQGGFVASEFPSFNPEGIGRYGSRMQKSTAAIGRGMGAFASALPRIDKRWEQALRKAKVKAELKRNPELRKAVEQLGRDTAAFEDLLNNPAAAALDDVSRLASPARDQFVKEMGTRFPGQQTDDIMAMTDLFAAYSARNKGIPLEQAYDDLVKGVTGAEADAGALAQAPTRPARIDEPSSSPEHAATLKALDEQWANLKAADDAWVAAGKPKKGPTADARNTAKNIYEAHRLDELHQRMWDGRDPDFGGTAHDADRLAVIHGLREKLGNRSGAWPKRFLTDDGALGMFRFLDELTSKGKAARFWYRDSGKAILRMVNGDKAEGAKVAQLVAIYSPQQAVVGNLGLAMRAYEAGRRGEKIPVGQAWQKAAAERVIKGTGGWDGRKTNNFYGNLLQWIDKKKFREEGYTGDEVTGDMWMSRVFGYPVDAVSEGRYDVIEQVAQQIARERGWKPQEVQAAIWTAIKDADVDDISANVDFAGAAERNIHTVNLEVTKGTEGIGSDLTHAQTEAVIRDLAPEIVQAAQAHRLDIRARTLGVGDAEDIRVGPGGYEGDRNATAYFEVSGAPDDVQAFVDDLADGFDQYEVWATREGTTGGAKPTIVIRHPELANPQVADVFFGKLHEVMGKRAAGFAMTRNADGIQIITTGSVTRATLPKLEADFKAAIKQASEAAGVRGVKYHGTQSSVIKGKRGNSERVRADLGGVEGAGGAGGRSVAAGDPATLRAALERAVDNVRSGRREGGAGGAVPERSRGVPGDDAGRGVGRSWNRKLYHGTRREYRDQIQREGLIPRRPNPGDGYEELPVGTFLGTTPEEARDWAGPDGDVWEVGADDLKIEVDPNSYNINGVDDNYYSQEHIGPDRLRLYDEQAGQLFQGQRGAFDASTRLIHLFESADPTTAIHEFVHAVDTGGGFTPQHVRALEEWSGAQHGTREFSEAAAQGFELYLREGRAPTAQLANLFARWKALLSRVYRKATDLGRPISSEVRAVFDDILAPPQHAPNQQAPLNALDQALTENPDLVYQIYDRVNDALGDFDHMSPAERSVLRSLFPFYSWFKAIVGVAGKLTLEQPLKVNVMAHLGAVAVESALDEAGIPREEWPENLLAMVNMSRDTDGRIKGFSTSGLNPYGTVAQIGAFAAALGSLEPGEAGRTLPGLNPLLSDVGSYVWGQTPQGYEVHGVGTVETLPFTRLLKAFELTYGVDIPWLGPASSKDPLYDHNFLDEVLRYAGVPYARVSPTAAKRLTADR